MTKRERDEVRRLCEAAPAHEWQTWFPAEWAEVEFYEAARTALPAALNALDECIVELKTVLHKARRGGPNEGDGTLWHDIANLLRKLGELPE